MLVQENYKDNVSFERVQRTLYKLDVEANFWEHKVVYWRLLKLTQKFIRDMHTSSYEFNLYNRSYIGDHGGNIELSFRIPTELSRFSKYNPETILLIAEFMRDFIHIKYRFDKSGIRGSITFENCDNFHVDLLVVIPVDFVENYNN